jgi:predicted nucleic acid-binding protein
LGLSADIGPGAVAIDTAVFIYFIEENRRYLPLVARLFEEADSGKRELVTSAVTLLEVLVVPYRAGDVQLATRYEVLLTRSRGVHLVDVTRDQLRAAAQLRAATGMRTPDALQIASALSMECRTFLTNDRGLPAVPGLRIVQLSSFLEGE